MQVRFAETDDLEGHVALIRRQLELGLTDPELVSLAGRIQSGRADEYRVDPTTGMHYPIVRVWGQEFWLPMSQPCAPKDDLCELQRIWEFVILNLRYTYDSNHIDVFKTPRRALLDGAGDCDDGTIVICALARAVGFSRCHARVISVDGEEWVHIYPIIEVPKEGGTPYALDFAVEQYRMGDEAGFVAKADFPMS